MSQLLSHPEAEANENESYAASPAPEEMLEPPFHQKLTMISAIVFPFIGLIIAVATAWKFGWMGWSYVAMLIGGWMLTGLGITVGFHRLMSHRAFETPRIVRAFWMTLGAMSVEGSPVVWSAVHRRHHAYSDKHGDPHSPHLSGDGWWGKAKGLVHAQFGWLVFDGRWSEPELDKYVPDLMKDPWMLLAHRHYGWFVFASLLIPAGLGWLIGGTLFSAWLGFLWGGLVRVFVTHHITWSINSICHVFGHRTYEAGDHSTNNAICGILGLGEGWHNNHHAFPNSARHGLQWWQFDMSWIVIRAMQSFGLAWNVKLPSKRHLASKRLAQSSS